MFQPRFDHNLRDQGGDTPLMVACRHSRLENVKLLLQSAVYANHMPGDEELVIKIFRYYVFGNFFGVTFIFC